MSRSTLSLALFVATAAGCSDARSISTPAHSSGVSSPVTPTSSRDVDFVGAAPPATMRRATIIFGGALMLACGTGDPLSSAGPDAGASDPGDAATPTRDGSLLAGPEPDDRPDKRVLASVRIKMPFPTAEQMASVWARSSPEHVVTGVVRDPAGHGVAGVEALCAISGARIEVRDDHPYTAWLFNGGGFGSLGSSDRLEAAGITVEQALAAACARGDPRLALDAGSGVIRLGQP